MSFDPLIAEAKRRTLRRRFVFGALALLVVAVALTLWLRPFGGAPGERVTIHGQSSSPLARLTVPLDAAEKHWRSMLPALEGNAASPAELAAVRRQVAQMLRATGVTLVRGTIWPRTSPPAVELVVATRTAPAIFVHRRFMGLLTRLTRPDYLRVVDAHGSEAFEWGGAANEGFVGSSPALEGCTVGMHSEAQLQPPACPVDER
jgi:hypothetical protein